MEVIEDGNIMDRIPILLQRDLEYYQKNQTVLCETICPGVVGGRLDFPRSASFAAVKLMLWFEDEFRIAFKKGSGMFVTSEGDDDVIQDGGVAKTSDPDKFVQLVVKSADLLLEHLHMLVQEALDHADLPVLTATLGAAALIRNTLHCYLTFLQDNTNSTDRQTVLQACHKRYTTMSEAVGERALDLHCRVVSLYVLQDSGGRHLHLTHSALAGAPSVQGWWLYMEGSRKDLFETVPPRMAQRIFAGMLNETLTILCVRYCQSTTTQSTSRSLVNDIVNILLCVAQLLPAICSSGRELCGVEPEGMSRDVRDVHSKCTQLYNCMVYRGADLHHIQQVFNEPEEPPRSYKDAPIPWFAFVSPHLFDPDDMDSNNIPKKTALALELIVLMAQPQPSWTLLVKVLLMRRCALPRVVCMSAVKRGVVVPPAEVESPASGRWYGGGAGCGGVLCTRDGYCTHTTHTPSDESARAVGAITYVLTMIGSKEELESTLVDALETSGTDWAACLDKRQVWCGRRPPWLSGVLSTVGEVYRPVPPLLVAAAADGASVYQTMSLCLWCVSRSLQCVSASTVKAAQVLQESLPSHVRPVGGSVLLQLIITTIYEEVLLYAHAHRHTHTRTSAGSELNGDLQNNVGNKTASKVRKQVRIASTGQTSGESEWSRALCVCEGLCGIGEEDRHTQELEGLLTLAHTLHGDHTATHLPNLHDILMQGKVPVPDTERASDAAALTSQLLMLAPGRDSLRVIYGYLMENTESVLRDLGVEETVPGDPRPAPPLRTAPTPRTAPILYTMFHIGRRPFDLYLGGRWPVRWREAVRGARRHGGEEGARGHLHNRGGTHTCTLFSKI